MIALIQRVSHASVTANGRVVGAIDKGLLVLLGVEKEDDEKKALRLSEKVLGYRVFSDEQGKMNLNVQQANGELLVISQFTLAANTSNGMRPSFDGAAPEKAERLYQLFTQHCKSAGMSTQTGVFSAMMDVQLVNNGPVTFWLQT